MNPIVYIALAVPFVGFLARHFFITKDRYNEALRMKSLKPAARLLLLNGILFIIIAAFIGFFYVRSFSDMPILIVVIFFLIEATWDIAHGLKLRRMSLDSMNTP